MKQQLQLEKVRDAEHWKRMNTFGESFNHGLTHIHDSLTPVYELRRGDTTKAVVRIPTIPVVIVGWHPGVQPIDVHEGMQSMVSYLKIESERGQKVRPGCIAADIDHPKFTEPLMKRYGLLPTGLQLFDIDTR